MPDHYDDEGESFPCPHGVYDWEDGCYECYIDILKKHIEQLEDENARLKTQRDAAHEERDYAQKSRANFFEMAKVLDSKLVELEAENAKLKEMLIFVRTIANGPSHTCTHHPALVCTSCKIEGVLSRL